MIFKHTTDKKAVQNNNSVSVKPVIHLEQLEPRILLSGDSLLNIAPNPQQDTIDDNTSLTDQYAELLDTQEPVEEQISLELTQSDSPDTNICQPIFTLLADDNKTNDESVDADLSVDNIGPAQTGEIALLLYDSNEDIESNIGTIEDDSTPTYINDADLSIEYATSIEIRGCPSDKLYRETIWDKSAGSGGLRWVRQGASFCEPDKTLRKPRFCIPYACARG